jgi:hypothetical protein
VRFGRATGQDAASAVSAFDDILDSFGLTADDAAGIMDKLVVSHQKFGGSIEENQAALSHMAPQLKALNLGLDDGIGLLNLFAASGLDASAGQKALNQAISKLPAGETWTSSSSACRRSRTTASGRSLPCRSSARRRARGSPTPSNPASARSRTSRSVPQTPPGRRTRRPMSSTRRSRAASPKPSSIAGASLRQFGADFGPALTGVASLGTLVGGVFPGIGSKIVGGLAGAVKGSVRSSRRLLGLRSSGRASSRIRPAPRSRAPSGQHGRVERRGVGGEARRIEARRVDRPRHRCRRRASVWRPSPIRSTRSSAGSSKKIHDALGLPNLPIPNPNDLPWPIGNKGAPDWAKFSSDAKEGATQVSDAVNQGLAPAGEGANSLSRTIAAQAPAAETAGKTVGSAAAKGAATAAPAADTAGKKVGNAFQAAMTGAVKKAGRHSRVRRARPSHRLRRGSSRSRTRSTPHSTRLSTSRRRRRLARSRRPT